jgi:hypothetical protein
MVFGGLNISEENLPTEPVMNVRLNPKREAYIDRILKEGLNRDDN